MRKILLIVLVILGFGCNLFASNRVTLVEHFTGASCTPCAGTNPKTDPVYDSFLKDGKIALIKYQVYINKPEDDPMYKDNPTLSSTRADYYNISSVPTIIVEGNKYAFGSGVTQASLTSALNNTLAINSKWDVNVDYNFNAECNKISIKMDFKSLEAQAGKFVAHVAIVENEINYPTAPGSNGEKQFIHVARKMLPTPNGTILKENWNANEESSLTFDLDVPYYFRDLTQLSVIAFIQDNTTKNIQQAAYCAPKAISKPNMDIALVKALPLVSYDNDIKVVLKNNSSTTLTSATFRITFTSDNTSRDVKWTGNLAAGATSTEIAIPGLNVQGKYGNIPYVISVLNPNDGIDTGLVDNFIANNVFGKPNPEVTPLPIFEDFEVDAPEGGANYYKDYKYPSTLTNAFLYDPNLNESLVKNWNGANNSNMGANNSVFMILFRNYTNKTMGDIDEYYLPTTSFVGVQYPRISFYHAYCPYKMASKSDSLKIQISTDSGNTWTDVYKLGGASLNTTSSASTMSPFAPTQSDWKKTMVKLDEYIGQSTVNIRFRGVNAYNNNLYLDQILLENNQYASLPSISTSGNISVYPTIVKDFAHVSFAVENTTEVNIKLYNLTGSEVLVQKLGVLSPGDYTEDLDCTAYQTGSYILVVETNGMQAIKKIAIIK